jgi:radical SAM-linked protein
MSDQRLLFRKEGRAVYISHLDLMRTFQRAFLRAGIGIRHTGGFNPHAFVSIAVPLSLGYGSVCELLDFGLESGATMEEVPEKLNRVLPEGITIVKCYEATRPVKEIGKLLWKLELEYDNGVPDRAEDKLSELFSRPELVMQKKSKKAKSGFTTVDLIPLMGEYRMEREKDNTLTLYIQLAGQNPGLNPSLLSEAISVHYPELTCDFLRATRQAVFDLWGEPFV